MYSSERGGLIDKTGGFVDSVLPLLISHLAPRRDSVERRQRVCTMHCVAIWGAVTFTLITGIGIDIPQLI